VLLVELELLVVVVLVEVLVEVPVEVEVAEVGGVSADVGSSGSTLVVVVVLLAGADEVGLSVLLDDVAGFAADGLELGVPADDVVVVDQMGATSPTPPACPPCSPADPPSAPTISPSEEAECVKMKAPTNPPTKSNPKTATAPCCQTGSPSSDSINGYFNL